MLDDAGSTAALPTVIAPPVTASSATATATTSTATTSTATTATGPDRRLHSDPHDFAGLYIRHHSSFTLHARRYLRDQRDADEVVQEAFLRLFLALPELETELQALAYCRRTITNLCIDRYRSQARRPRLVDLDSAPVDLLVDDDPGDPVVRAEDAALVREALSLLSPLHRAALVKREIEEKPLPVIAQELSIPEDNVKHLLFRARRALRKLLAGTALAPGIDDERGASLVTAGKAGSGGLGALVLLLVLGLGSGPNLEAVPVVGVDLPDVLGVEKVVRTVGEAVTVVVDRVSPGPGPAMRPLDVVESSDGSATDAEVSGAGPAPVEGAPRGSTVPAAGASGSATAPSAGGATGAQAPAAGAAAAPGAGSVVVRPVPTLAVTPGDPRPVTAVGPRPAPRAAAGAPVTAGSTPGAGASGTVGPRPVPVGSGASGSSFGQVPSVPGPVRVVPPPADTPPAEVEAKQEAAAAKVEAKQEAAAAKVEAKQEAAAAKAEAKQEAAAAKAEAKQEAAAAKAEAKQEAAQAKAKAEAKQEAAAAKAEVKAEAAQAKAEAAQARAQARAQAAQARAEAAQARANLEQGTSSATVPAPDTVVPAGG